MMRSLFSGVSGLRVHQAKMDVLGNNIANVNTVGYKSSRVTFNEVFSQNVGSASAANPAANRGGINPMQIGLGAGIASIDKLMTTGASQRTDNPFDLMIQGDGFFIVGDSSGTYFTRAGALNLDAEGNLVTSAGLKVMGWNANTDGTDIVGNSIVSPITITDEKEYINPSVTTKIAFSGNLNAATNTAIEKVASMTFYDSVGNSYVINAEMQFIKGASGEPDSWAFRVRPMAYPNGDMSKGIAVTVDPETGEIDFTTPPTSDAAVEVGRIMFNTNGLPVMVKQGEGTPSDPTDSGTKIHTDINDYQLTLTIIPGNTPPETADSATTPGASFGKTFGTTDNVLVLDFKNLTQFGNETSNATSRAVDGNSSGNLNGVSIGSDGKITGRYSNGQTKLLGQIPIAVFKNPAGLEKIGNNLFVTTPNSGEFDGIGQDVLVGGGSMLGGVLEMSNVDLSSEFTEMITTQRGFQANSRVITTSDDMLQELVNLKR